MKGALDFIGKTLCNFAAVNSNDKTLESCLGHIEPTVVERELQPRIDGHSKIFSEMNQPAYESVDWKAIKNKINVPSPTRERLVIGVSSGVLFDMRADHDILKNQGAEAFRRFEIENENNCLQEGEAFSLVQKLLALNEGLDDDACIEVVVISKNQPESCVRTFKSIEAHNLPILRAAFTGGQPPFAYAKAFGTHLYLSTNREDVEKALDAGIAAAEVIPSMRNGEDKAGTLKIAFDADAVVFSDESERINHSQGLQAFYDHEQMRASEPMDDGPMKPFIQMLQKINAHSLNPEDPIARLAIVTARCAPAHERVINTLNAWDVAIDEIMFLGGLNKTPFLKGVDIFFDDSEKNVKAAASEVTAAHVPYGVNNNQVA